MYEFSTSELILSVLFTWVVGLAPPALIRFAFLKCPIEKWPAIGICALFWVCNIVLFTALGSRSKTHGALLLIAFVSYAILRRQGKSPAHETISLVTQKAEPQANPAPRLNKLGGWERLLAVVSTSWLLFATITYFLALDGNSWFLGLVPSSAFSWSVDLFSAPSHIVMGCRLDWGTFISMDTRRILALAPRTTIHRVVPPTGRLRAPTLARGVIDG